jgi:putative transposase
MSQRHPIQNDVIMLITIVTARRMPIFKDAACALEAIETLYRVQALHPFFLYGFVMMPDHCHLLLKVPSPQSVSKIVGIYKSGLVFNLRRANLWQPRFHVRISNNVREALRYVHLNPVRKGMVECPEQYPWSSASGKWDVSPLEFF